MFLRLTQCEYKLKSPTVAKTITAILENQIENAPTNI